MYMYVTHVNIHIHIYVYLKIHVYICIFIYIYTDIASIYTPAAHTQPQLDSAGYTYTYIHVY